MKSLERATRVLALLIVAMFAFSALPATLTGHSAIGSAAAATAATEVKVGWLSDIIMWNPMNIEMVEDYVACYLMYSALFTYDQDWNGPVGDLALSWYQRTQPDETMITIINITHNAYFRNKANFASTAQPLWAEDVKYTYQRILNNSGGAWDTYLMDVTDITVINHYQLAITTAYPKATLIDDLSGIPIISHWQWDSISDVKFLTSKTPASLVGSGPFYYNASVTGSWYRFTKCPNYFAEIEYPGVREIKYVKSILYTVYTSDSAMTIAMNDGAEDTIVLSGSPNLYLSTLGHNANVNIIKQAIQEPGICDVAVNAIPYVNKTLPNGYGTTKSEGNMLLLDPAVRQAIAMTMDKDTIVNTYLMGLARKAESVVQPGYWQKAITPTPFNTTAAKALLMANGYQDTDGDLILEATSNALPVQQGWTIAGKELEIEIHAINTDPSYYVVAQNWAAWMGEAGIHAIPMQLSETVMTNNDWYKAKYDIWVWHWGWGPEPLSTLSCWLWKEMKPGGDNAQMPMGPTPGDFDALWHLAQRTVDKSTRKIMVDQLQQWVHDSYCENPPFYDLGLYGMTDERWFGWGNWTQHVGHSVTSDLLWLWYDLSPNLQNKRPVFDTELNPTYYAIVDISQSFSVTVHDEDGDPLTVNWSFGDGATVQDTIPGASSTTPTPVPRSHTYTTVDMTGLTMTVKLWDHQAGHEVTSTAIVYVQPKPDTAPVFTSSVSANPPSPSYIGTPVTWSISAMDAESGGASGFGLRFTWVWGDGSYTVTNYKPTTNSTPVTDTHVHSWSVDATYPVRVWVWDGFGTSNDPVHNISSGVVSYVVKANMAPAAPTVASIVTLEDLSTECVATSSDPDPDLLTFTWDWHDGTYNVTHHDTSGSPGSTVTSAVWHTWADPGTFPVTVYVCDADPSHNESTTIDAQVNSAVVNSPPTALQLTPTPASGLAYNATTISFSASAIDSDMDALNFYLEYGDGAADVATSAGGTIGRQSVTFTHAYASSGTFTTTLWVNDSNGPASHNITISQDYVVLEDTAPNAPEIAAISGPEGTSIPCSATAWDLDPTMLRFTWDFGNGTLAVTDHDNSADPGADVLSSVTNTWATTGNYLVTVYVDDLTGYAGHNVSSSTVAVITAVGVNSPPTSVQLSAIPTSQAYVDTTVTFNASAVDLDGDPLEFYIVFGDGTDALATTAGGTTSRQYAEFAHVYTATNIYNLHVHVYDMTGDVSHNVTSGTLSYRIIADTPPTTPVIAGISGVADSWIECTAHSSDADPGSLRFTWVWDDGTFNVTESVNTAPGTPVVTTVSHTWTGAGDFAVTVWTDDLTGTAGHNVSSATTAHITAAVVNIPPSGLLIVADPTAPFVGDTVTFTVSAVDIDGESLEFYVEFGDGNASVNTTAGGSASRQYATVTHVYDTAGTYTVTLWVNDSYGPASHNVTTSTSIDVSEVVVNQPPTLSLPSAFQVAYNATFTVHPQVSDPDDDALAVWYSWGDGSALQLSTAVDYSASHAYHTLGAKTVTVYADDGHGHNVSATVTVTVIEGNQKPTIVSFAKSPASTATDGSYPPNTTITFTLVVNDYDGDMLGIAIDFGDGSDIYTTVIDSRPQTDETVTTTHNYTLANAVAYTVTAVVVDDQEHANMDWSTDTMDVKITAVAPPTPPHKVDNTALYLAIGVVAAIAVIAALLLLMRRKKKSAPAEIAPEPPPPGQ
jgi:ABC-type transport system substrate-binding protein